MDPYFDLRETMVNNSHYATILAQGTTMRGKRYPFMPVKKSFLWNSFPRSPGPPDEVVGRWGISGVSSFPSALETGVAAFNLSKST